MSWREMNPNQLENWIDGIGESGPYRTACTPPKSATPAIPPPPRSPKDLETHVTIVQMHESVERQLRDLTARVQHLYVQQIALCAVIALFVLVQLVLGFLRR